MEDIESYDLVLHVKELKLSVKFPCRLTLQHAGKPLSPQIQSSGSNVFPLNRDINLKEDKKKDATEINVNLMTDKGGNIMAGIIKINLKEVASQEGQTLTVPLQKCLDPYATCLLIVKTVKLSHSRARRGTVGDDWKSKVNQGRFESKSQSPVMDIRNFKARPRYNDAESSFVQKRVNINTSNTPTMGQLKQKALSTVGFRAVNTSFDRQQLASRFKHFGRNQNEESKTVIPSKWREADQSFKASFQANEKTLKLQILKYKTKFDQSQRNIEQKTKQIKTLKDQISDMNRQLTEKHFLIEELNSKNTHINKLEQTNKSMSRQIHQERNRMIDLERELEEQKNNNFTQMSRFRQDNDKKEHELQKSLYEKKEEIKQVAEQNQYKINQINKMKSIIEDLESNLENKTYQYEKIYSHEKTEHQKTKILLEQKINELTNQHKKMEEKNEEIVQLLLKSEEANKKLQNKVMILESTLLEQEHKLKDEQQIKEKQAAERKRLEKVEEQLSQKIKYMLKDQSAKQKQLEELQNQLSELSNSSKKKSIELIEKNKGLSSKVQQLENKINILSAQEQKLKRNLDMSQKEVKNLQQNEKNIIKNSKQKDDRILQMEKELTELESKINMKESLGKKEAEYKAIQLEKLTTRVSELEKSYDHEKQSAEDRRLELLKSQNKVRMLEESITRLNDQIKDLKTTHIKKEDDWMDKIKELKDELKIAQAKQAEYNKQIHSAEIQKINLKNEISKLQKLIQSSNEKNERLKKKQIELENQIKLYSNDLDLRNEEIVELEANFKAMQNDYKALQADKNKTEKITSIIKEQKVSAVGDINKLKKQIQKRQQKEQEYLQQIKRLKEQIVKWELKWNATSKDYEKFKTNMLETIKSTLSMKTAFNAIDGINGSLENSRVSMNRSRMRVPFDYNINLDGNESRFSEVIENYARQSQQIIASLTDDLKKVKKEKQTLEKDHQQLNTKFKIYEDDTKKRIDELTNEIQQLGAQNAADIDEYEQKTMNLQRQIKKRDKTINDLIEQLQELRIIQNNERSSHEAGASQLLSKIHSLKSKIADYEAKDENNSAIFVNLQQKLSNLQSQNTDLIHQNEILSQQLIRKEKDCEDKFESIEELTLEVEQLKKVKNDLFTEVLGLKENLTIEKENLRHTSAELKQQQTKNSQLRVFNAEILKEKEMLIKKEAELSQKVNGLEDKVQMLMIDNAEKNQQLLKRENTINEYRESSKQMHLENNTHLSAITDLKIEVERQREKLKDRERRINERDQQIESLNAHNKKTVSKLEEQIIRLKQQIQTLTDTLRKEQTATLTKINELQFEIKRLKDSEKKLNDDNIVLEEQIFFEKQMHSLANSRADEVQQDVTKLTIEIDNLTSNINELNQELRQKDQTLFALSGKLYNTENKIESKEEECRARIEKADLEWRYKVEEICQEYENKLELLQRQKSYVRSDVQGASQTVQKLQNENTKLRQQIQREREIWQSKLKKVEEEKLVSLIDKNRQIEKIKEVFEQLEEKLKRKDFQLKSIQDDKKKVEQKLKQLRTEIEKSEEKRAQMVITFQREIDQYKRKQGQLKRFKEALKNNQWTIERQVKKGVQNCAKSLVNISKQEVKEQVMHLMRNLETSVAKLACPNIDQL